MVWTERAGRDWIVGDDAIRFASWPPRFLSGASGNDLRTRRPVPRRRDEENVGHAVASAPAANAVLGRLAWVGARLVEKVAANKRRPQRHSSEPLQSLRQGKRVRFGRIFPHESDESHAFLGSVRRAAV